MCRRIGAAVLLIVLLGIAGCGPKRPATAVVALPSTTSPLPAATRGPAAARPTSTLPPEPTAARLQAGPPTARPEPTPVPPSPTATSIPLPWPTFTPLPTVPRTPVAGCPAPGNPPAPLRTSHLDEFAGLIESFLNAGGSMEVLDQTLRQWSWLTNEHGFEEHTYEGRMAWQVDLTGDGLLETMALANYCSNTCPCFGDLLIWQCRDGQMELLFSAAQAITLTEGSASPYYQVLQIRDANEDDQPEVIFRSSWPTMHANMVRLHAVEWDGTGFVQRISGFPEMPDTTFALNDLGVFAIPGWFSSRGAGIYREYYQVWRWEPWEGPDLYFSTEVYGLQNARIQYLYDGDDALMREKLVAAISNYRQALDRTDLPTGLMSEREETLLAVARFKLVVAYAMAEEGEKMEATYQELEAGAPRGSDDAVYPAMARAFLQAFQAGSGAHEACAAATAVLAGNRPALFDLDGGFARYGGFASTRYVEPEDLCRVP